MPNPIRRFRQTLPILGLIAWAALSPGLLPAQTPESPRWKPLGPFGGVVNRLAAHPTVPGVLYGGGYLPGLVRTMDGGASWQVLPGTPFAPSAVGIDPSRPATLYTGGTLSGNVVLKSTDGGDHWRVASRDLPSDFFPRQFEVDPSRPSRIYATGNLHGIWRKSTDAGASWQPTGLRDQLITALAASPVPGVLWAATQGGAGIFRSEDSGATWQDRSGDIAFYVNEVQDFAFDPDDPRRVYAAGFGGVWVLEEED